MTEQPSGVIAVDAGGTSTRGMVVTTAGACLSHAVAGSGNPTAVGPEAAAAAVARSVREAVQAAAVPVRLAVLAMAGAGTRSVAAEIGQALAGFGLDVPLVFESDLVATYFSGTRRPTGYALIAGTGAGAIRVEDGQQIAVADGLGWLLGDEGSGFWIGQRVVRAVLAHLDARGPATALTPLLLARLGVPGQVVATDREPIVALLRTMYGGAPVRLADHARLAFEVGDDPIAGHILDGATQALQRTLTAVRVPSVTGPVVLGGGMLGHGGPLADRLTATLASVPGLADVYVVPDGTLGACVLALRHAGTAVDDALFARLSDSLAAIR